jgi:hypothetical protein
MRIDKLHVSHTSDGGKAYARIRLALSSPAPAAAMAAMGITLAVAGCGTSRPANAGQQTTAQAPAMNVSQRVAQIGERHVPARRRPSPGSLPQTHAFPSSGTAQFRAEMAALWSAIVTGSADRALPAFFPEQAYVRLKAIPSAESDWRERLVGDLRLDVGAAHALLGAGAASARLVAVRVPGEYGHWVPPGVCYNAIGYYEVPNSRIVYREDGRVRSFGIASMISWRGEWYVVHLGAVLRSGDEGVVDEPSAGVGSSTDSGTC